MSTGGYEWSVPSADEIAAFKCLTQEGDTYDEGRYRQVYLVASSDNCVETIVRNSLVADGETQTITIKVWPEVYPVFPDF